MRIAYLCHWNLAAEDGVSRKIAMQSSLWRAAGHEARVFVVSPEPVEREGVEAFVFRGGAARAVRTLEAVRAVRRFAPDIVYLRYDVLLPPIWRLVHAEPTVVEVNSDTGDRMRAIWRSNLVRRYNLLNRRAILSGADGAVAVSHELAGGTKGLPTIVIANGIDLEHVQELPAPANSRPRGLFLGSPRQPWHGVDKLLRFAARTPGLDVDVVGYAHDDRSLAGVRMPPNVRLHGYLSRVDYLPLARRADFALGSLAMHRAGLAEGAPLKVREYLALGLPVAIAYADTDLLGVEAPWLLRLPNTEDNLEAGHDALATFASAARGLRADRSVVESRIGALQKEHRRLQFFESIVSR